MKKAILKHAVLPKVLMTLALLVAMLVMLTVAVGAESYTGESGDVKWSLDTETGVLSVTGTGALPDYSATENAPWYAYASSVKTVTVGEGITGIGAYAFYGCGDLTGITLPTGVEDIGSYAFGGCVGLKSVTLPDSVTHIGAAAFSGCSALESITLPFVGDSLKTAEDTYQYPLGYIFGTAEYTGGTRTWQDYYGSSLSSTDNTYYYIPTSLTSVTVTGGSILRGAFYNCANLTSVTLPSTADAIGAYAFYNCTNLSSVTLPSTVDAIGAGAFYNCTKLTSVTLPSAVTSIGEKAFYTNTALESVTFAETSALTEIGAGAFSGCSTLKGIVIPSGVMSIGAGAFSGCSALESITLPFVGDSLKTAEDTYQYPFGYIFGTDSYTGGTSTMQYYNVSNTVYYYYIPTTLTSVTVMGGNIPYGAFYNCTNLTSITLPSGAVSMGTAAFYNCKALTAITIPSGIESIGNNTFYQCVALADITFGEGSKLTQIGNQAFAKCSSLKSMVIPQSVTSMGFAIFSGCSSLESLTIPFVGSTVKPSADTYRYPLGYIFGTDSYEGGVATKQEYVGSNINSLTSDEFYIPSTLKTVTVTGGQILYGAFYNCTGLTGISLSGGVTGVANNAFYNCTGLIQTENGVSYMDKWVIGCDTTLESVTLREDTVGIADYAFSGCKLLTSIVLPETVTAIGSHAFSGCSSLAAITVPAAVTSIGSYAFSDATSLAAVTFAEGSKLSELGTYAFRNASALKGIVIPQSVTSMGFALFSGCSALESMTLPFVGGSLTTAEDTYQYPFGYIFGTTSYTGGASTEQYYYGSSITSTTSNTFYIPTALTSVTVTGGNIPYGAFYNCTNLTSITLPSGAVSMGAAAFYNCKALTAITIPSGIESIGKNTFYQCVALATVTFAEGSKLTQIGNQAFAKCSSLKSMVIPQSVTSMGSAIFSGCSSLESLTLPFIGGSITTAEDTNRYPLGYIFGTTSYTGGASTEQYYYGSSTTWTTSNYYYIPTTLTSVTVTGGDIPYGAFYNCTNLTSVTLPSGAVSMGAYAFYNCKALTAITIPSGITEIGDSTFYNCSALAEITIPAGVASIGANAFYGCILPTTVTIPAAVTQIGENAFRGCTALATVTFAEGSKLTQIGNQAFANCSSLKSMVIPQSVTSMGSAIFSGCSSLESLTIPFVGNTIKTSADTYRYPLGYIFGTNSYTGATSTRQYYYGSYTTSTTNSRYYIPDTLTSVTVTGGPLFYGAFYGCSNLTTVTLGDAVTGIDASAFYNCQGLTSLSIGKGVTRIGENAFSGCESLTGLTLPAALTSIEKNAFAGCKALFQIENGVSYVDKWVVAADASVIGATLRANTVGIAHFAFAGCSRLTSVSIPSGVTAIGNSAFADCANLSVVRFDGNAPGTVGENLFPSKSSGKFSIYYNSTATGWTSPTWNEYPCYPLQTLTDYATLDENNANSQGLTFLLDDATKEATLISSEGYVGVGGGIVVIPEYVTKGEVSYRVTSIDQKAFLGNTLVTSISIPAGVINIADGAFANCIYLEKLIVDAANTRYSTDESGVLYNRSKTQLICYPAGSTAEKFTIPSTVLSIKMGAFAGVQRLKTLELSFIGSSQIAEKADSVTLFGYLFGTESYLNSYRARQYYSEYEYSDYYLPMCLKQVNVLAAGKQNTIFYGSFYGCSYLESIVVSEGVVTVGEHAFFGCSSLKSATLPTTVTSIGAAAFGGCGSLQSLTLPFVGADATTTEPGPTTLLGYIFGKSSYTGALSTKQYYSSSKSVTYYIPSSLKQVTVTGGSILYGAFYNCSTVETVVLPTSLSSIGGHAFYNCTALSACTLPETVTSIGSYGFYGCTSLASSVNLPKLLTLESYVFYDCQSLQTVVLPAGLTEIGDSAFYNCRSLTGFVIPTGVTKLGKYAFYGCQALTEITIPEGVTQLGTYAFYGCVGLSKLHFNAIACADLESGNRVFQNAGKDGEGIALVIGAKVERIPAYLFSPYTNATYAPNIVSLTFEGTKCREIGARAFAYCEKLVEVKIPAGTEIIGAYAFYKCIGMTTLTLGNNVKTVGAYAFYSCDGLTSVVIPNDVTVIDDYAFADCGELTTLDIGSGLTTVGQYAFTNCPKLTSVALPDSVTSIGSGAFSGCIALEKLTVPFVGGSVDSNTYFGYIFGASGSSYNTSSVPPSLKEVTVSRGTVIPASAFYGCSSLQIIRLPSTVTTIGEYAFQNCSSLKSIEVSDAVTTLGKLAFDGCTSVETIYIGQNVTDLTAFDFADYTALGKLTVSKLNTAYSSDSQGVLFNKDQTTLICYPQAKTVKYYSVPKTVTAISAGAFVNNDKLETVVLSPQLASIGDGNFRGCSRVFLLVYDSSVAYDYAINNGLNYDKLDASMTYTAISVEALPEKTVFVEGAPITFDGLVILADCVLGRIPIDSYTLTYTADTVGTHTVTVALGELTTSFEIQIVAKTIAGIEVTTPPTKLEHVEGLPIDFSGLVVSVFYDNGTYQEITDYTLAGYDPNSVCRQTVTVTHLTFTTEFDINVVPKKLVSITITTNPTKTTYELGEDIVLDGIVVKRDYDNGTTDSAAAVYVAGGYDKNLLGEQTVTVSDGEISTTFTVTFIKHTAGVAGAPTLSGRTDTKVILTEVPGYEYSRDGETWQSSPSFEGLTQNTTYTFYARLAETADTYAGAPGEALTVTTCSTVSGAVKVTGLLAEGSTLLANLDQVTPDGKTVTYQWYINGVAVVGATSESYVVSAFDLTSYISVKITGTGDYAGELLGYAQAPLPKVESFTSSTITVKEVTGNEYSLDGENWQSGAVFENLKPGTQYTVYQRVAATAVNAAGEISAAYTVTTIEVHTVTWSVNGTEITEIYEHGATPSFKGSTDKPADAQYTYTFVGWDREFVAVTEDVTYTAQYTSTINSYTVTWVVDGNTTSAVYEYGAMPVFEGSTDKAADAQYTYTFMGWDAEIVSVTADVTYTAQYEKTVNRYTVTWMVDGMESTEIYEYGQTPSYKGSTDKVADAQYTYTFAGWDAEITEVIGNVTYTAQYELTLNQYTVIWIVDGVEASERYDYGAMPSFGGETDKAADAQYTYTFAGFSPAITAVTGNITYTAQYEKTVNQYTVTWSIDGKITTESYDYGTTPTFKGSTEKPADVQYTYTFIGWDCELEAVTGDATYIAQYTPTVNQYTVTWVVGVKRMTETYEYGQMPSFSGNRERPADAQFTYAFIGWNQEIKEVTGHVTYTAQYSTTINRYMVIWMVGGMEIVDVYEYGQTPHFAGNPDMPADAQYTYTFTGWDQEIKPVNDNAVYTAQYETTLNRYTVTWNVDGAELTETYEYGQTPAFTGNTDKAADEQYTYTFLGWDAELASVTGDVTYTAQYETTLNQYTVTWNVDGAELTETYEYGQTPAFTGSTDKAADEQYTYTFIGWDREPTAVTGDVTYTAQYSAEELETEPATETETETVFEPVSEAEPETETETVHQQPTETGPSNRPSSSNCSSSITWSGMVLLLLLLSACGFVCKKKDANTD